MLFIAFMIILLALVLRFSWGKKPVERHFAEISSLLFFLGGVAVSAHKNGAIIAFWHALLLIAALYMWHFILRYAPDAEITDKRQIAPLFIRDLFRDIAKRTAVVVRKIDGPEYAETFRQRVEAFGCRLAAAAGARGCNPDDVLGGPADTATTAPETKREEDGPDDFDEGCGMDADEPDTEDFLEPFDPARLVLSEHTAKASPPKTSRDEEIDVPAFHGGEPEDRDEEKPSPPEDDFADTSHRDYDKSASLSRKYGKRSADSPSMLLPILAAFILAACVGVALYAHFDPAGFSRLLRNIGL
jgi:hypothetical protein